MTFKLATVSDLHIGYASTRIVDEQGINIRVADGYRALAEVVSQIIEHRPHAVLIPGDTFHHPEPKIRDIVYAQNQFRRFYEAGIPVYILAGNHDALDIASEVAASRVLNDPLRNVYSHVEPYVEYELADGLHVHMVSHHLYKDQAETLAKIKPHEGDINIFSTHGSVIDPIMKMKLHTEQSPREIVIPDSLLNDKGWSYNILGHIHERGWVGFKDKLTDTLDSKIFYCGSTIRRGFADKDAPLGRGWTMWTIDPDGTFTPEFHNVWQRPQGDFKPIDADNLSSKDITELIIGNLKKSHGYGESFDFREAPLLRQQIINLSPAKHRGLDWKAIASNSTHVADWRLKTTSIEAVEGFDPHSKEQSRAINNGDIVKIFEDWVDKSDSMAKVDKDNKGNVLAQAKKLIVSGRDGVLEDA